MQAVWMVRSRQLLTRFRFWLAIFGYDRKDRSFSHKIYLVYAALFYTVWAFAVLSLLAGGTAQFLQATGVPSLPLAAVIVSTLGLLVWAFYNAYTASRRSLLIFSEEDSYLICQTPVNRSMVTLAWLVGQWLGGAAPIWAAAITLGFAIVEGTSQGQLGGADIPRYTLAGLRSLSIVLPLHLGLLAFVWALGAYRLQSDRYRPHIYLVPLVLACVLVLAFLFQGGFALFSKDPVVSLMSSFWGIALWPLLIPLQAAFGVQAWLPGILVSLVLLTLGLLVLVRASNPLNLGRAAQETRSFASRQAALRVGAAKWAEEQDKKERLGIGHSPSIWLARPERGTNPAWSAVLRKDLVQHARSNLLPHFFTWLAIYGLILGATLSSDWGVQLWALLVWVSLVAHQATLHLQDDLVLWTVFRQLPLPRRNIIWSEIAIPALLATFLAWASLATSFILKTLPLQVPFWQPPYHPLVLVILAPVLVINVALSGTWDVIRQSRSADLLVGYAPRPYVWSLVLGGGVILLVVMLASKGWPVGVLIGFTAGLGGVAFFSWLAALSLSRVK